MNIPVFAVFIAGIAFAALCGLLFLLITIHRNEKEAMKREISMMEAAYLKSITTLWDRNTRLGRNNRELLAHRDTLRAERNRLDVDKLKLNEEIRVLKASESLAREEILRLKRYINHHI